MTCHEKGCRTSLLHFQTLNALNFVFKRFFLPILRSFDHIWEKTHFFFQKIKNLVFCLNLGATSIIFGGKNSEKVCFVAYSGRNQKK